MERWKLEKVSLRGISIVDRHAAMAECRLLAASGWEPYAVSESTMYFKRRMTDEEIAELEKEKEARETETKDMERGHATQESEA